MRRQNSNHFVDANGDGSLTVRYYNMLIRVAPPSESEQVRHAMLTEAAGGLPAILMHSIMRDTLRAGPDGIWRITRRELTGTVANAALRMEA